ncbi:MAG: type III pantothenate kinase [Bacteroidetes bacterium]|nr:type III pantothenate kinase [Bacteroidota bacterium]MBP6639651.1 type III pantothenate kinase [Bacteroidia bacterium]
MNIVVDIGNSRVKLGYFEGDQLLAASAFPHADYPQAVLASEPWRQYSGHSKYLGMASVGKAEMVKATDILLAAQPGLRLKVISRETALPIGNRYQTPQTLGMDRICAAVAGFRRAGKGPVLVVNAGTALTYDYVDANGDYLGGAISLGLRSRFRALYDYTAALPLLPHEGPLQWVGDTTETCMRSGLIHGIVLEIEGFIAQYQQLSTQPLSVFLTGGDAEFLGNLLKNITFVDSNLLLHGINTLIGDHA